MEIKIIDSLRQKLLFSESDKAYLSVLQEDNNLSQIINILRSKANIPVSGVSAERQQIRLSLEKVNLIELWKASSHLLSVYELPASWRTTMMSILLFGYATPPISIQIVKMSTGQKYVSLQDEVHIIITKKITKTELRDYINLHPEISRLLDSLPEQQHTGGLKTIHIGKRIAKYKKEGLTADKISREIEDIDLSPAEVGVYFKRYRELLDRILYKNMQNRLLKAIEL